MLQNLPYFYHKKTNVVFFISCNIREKIQLHEMKNEKNYMGFLMIKIWEILKRFGENKCLFLKSVCIARYSEILQLQGITTRYLWVVGHYYYRVLQDITAH